MTCKEMAALFPGQGAQAPGMLNGVHNEPAFAERYAVVCDALGVDVADALDRDGLRFLNRNEVSSLLTLLVSSLSYERWQATGNAAPSYLAGYSIGQWTALYAAGVVNFASLVQIVLARAESMNRCAASQPGGMIGVIGLGEGSIRNAIAPLQAAGYQVEISNFNCLGQYSLAAEKRAIEPAIQALQALEPRKVVELPVAGPWHSPLMQPAAAEFAAFLADVPLAPPQLPVLDNVTGDLLPSQPEALKAQLVAHLYSPVRWQASVERLIGLGCTHFVEFGYERMLTKFGFFIDRSRRHESFYTG